MKTYDETYNSVISKRDAYNEKKQKQNRTVKRVSAVSACVFVAVLTAGVLLNHFNTYLHPKANGEPETGDFDTFPALESGSEETSIEISFETEKTEPDENYSFESTENQTASTGSSDGDIVEEYSSGYSPDAGTTAPQYGSDDRTGAPLKIFPDEEMLNSSTWAGVNKAITGELLSDDEAAAYFAENGQSIISSLSASGVQTDNIKITEKGYCHMNISDSGVLETRINFRDYLVYNGSSLVAIVTLCKENGEIFSTPSFGAPWFSDYNDFLQTHKGQELVYVYCGITEYIITPDNQIFSPVNSNRFSLYSFSDSNFYAALNAGYNVYTP